MWTTIALIVVCILAGALAWKLGSTHAKLVQAEKKADEQRKDSEIDSRPGIDNPLSGMRPKN